jgi:hypothetical protein
MKRRKFIFTLVTVGIGAAALPIISYRRKNILSLDPLMRPNTLAHFCDGGTIRDIGMSYRAQVPQENEKKKLREILLTNKNGDKLNSSNEHDISNMLDSKIDQEFKSGQIVIENGWVLSETEARQCALFSFSDK